MLENAGQDKSRFIIVSMQNKEFIFILFLIIVVFSIGAIINIFLALPKYYICPQRESREYTSHEISLNKHEKGRIIGKKFRDTKPQKYIFKETLEKQNSIK